MKKRDILLLLIAILIPIAVIILIIKHPPKNYTDLYEYETPRMWDGCNYVFIPED